MMTQVAQETEANTDQPMQADGDMHTDIDGRARSSARQGEKRQADWLRQTEAHAARIERQTSTPTKTGREPPIPRYAERQRD